jgi:hypothetical protein
MFLRSISSRSVLLAWILAAALALVPLASVLAGGGGTNFPH